MAAVSESDSDPLRRLITVHGYDVVVGDDETDVKGNKIGISSPLARGLIGKRLGDEVVIRTPKGTKEFEILQVEYV